MEKKDMKLRKMQIIYLKYICNKGWGGFSKGNNELIGLENYGLLKSEDGPFNDVVYRPTEKGYEYIESI